MRKIHIKRFSTGSLIIAAIFAVLFIFISVYGVRDYRILQQITEQYLVCEKAAQKFQKGSDILTEQVRLYAMTGEIQYLDGYFEEANVTQNREAALAELEEYFADTQIFADLQAALEDSRALMEREIYAMRLVAESQNCSPNALPSEVVSVTLSAEDQALSAADKLEKARWLVSDDAYQSAKTAIVADVTIYMQELTETMQARQRHASSVFQDLYIKQGIALGLLIAFVILNSVIVRRLIVSPLISYNKCISQDESVPLIGAAELQSLAETYNQVFKENQETQKLIRHEAEHDALTDLLNRGSFNKALALYGHGNVPFALLLADVDKFKSYNDTYGHAVGDEILKAVAKRLQASFRSSDYIFRIGGDEFAVLMLDVPQTLRRTVEEKLDALEESLSHMDDSLPPVTLSIGVAFSEQASPGDIIFKDADAALYTVKEHGRNGYHFFEADSEQ